jgi:hypothetical protein
MPTRTSSGGDFPDTVAPIRTRTDLSEAAKAAILGDTAARFCRLALLSDGGAQALPSWAAPRPP